MGKIFVATHGIMEIGIASVNDDVVSLHDFTKVADLLIDGLTRLDQDNDGPWWANGCGKFSQRTARYNVVRKTPGLADEFLCCRPGAVINSDAEALLRNVQRQVCTHDAKANHTYLCRADFCLHESVVTEIQANANASALVMRPELGYLEFMTPKDIENLISKVAMGDRAAFGALYGTTSAKLFGVALRVLKDRTDAEDVLQEAFVKIWNNAAKYQVSGYSPMTWLIAIVRNQAIDRLRARKPDAAELVEADDIADTSATPEQHAVAGGETERLRLCLEKLSPGRAEAVKAAYMDGYSYQELADRLEQPINTVRTWLRRSLISLRECLSS